MSCSAIPFTYVSMHQKYYESMPKSIQIQMDNNTLFTELNHIETQIKEETISSILYPEYRYRHTEPLKKIINVFSDNVNYVNKEVGKFIPFEERTFEQYQQEHPASTLEDYESDERTRRKNFKKENFELAELYQLTPVLKALHQSITRIASKLRENDRIDPQSPLRPFSTIVKPKHPPAFFNFHGLRRVEAPIQNIEALVIESPEAVELETIEALDSTAPKVNVTVLLNLTAGQSLGICCDPTWGEQPIAFTASENSWKGHAPVNQDWKFVILQEGKVTSWEKGNNRRCHAETQAFTVEANGLRF